MQQHVTFVEQKLSKRCSTDENFRIVRDYCHFISKYRDAAHNLWNLRFNEPKQFLLFSNGSNCDYHFIIKELTKGFANLNVLLKVQKSTKTSPFQ